MPTLNMDALGALIEQLKAKEVITDLESDILETSKELSKEPFDRPSASLRMGLNYGKYPEIFIEASIASGGSAQPNYTLSNDAIRDNLQWQLQKLAQKELEAQHYGEETLNQCGGSKDVH